MCMHVQVHVCVHTNHILILIVHNYACLLCFKLWLFAQVAGMCWLHSAMWWWLWRTNSMFLTSLKLLFRYFIDVHNERRWINMCWRVQINTAVRTYFLPDMLICKVHITLCNALVSLVPRPSKREEGLVHTVCACTLISPTSGENRILPYTSR